MIVYCLTNLINGKQYVGQTTKPVEDRVKQHVRVAKRMSRNPIHCAIRKYGIDQFAVAVLQSCNTRQELNEAEIRWISLLETRKLGYNLSEGGSGVKGRGIWKHTAESKQKIGDKNRGKVRSLETRKLISESVHAAMTDELRSLISASTRCALTFEVRSKIERNNYAKRRKQIAQLTIEGQRIALFKSATEAAAVTNTNKGNLCACARGECFQAGGFRWEYVTNNINQA